MNTTIEIDKIVKYTVTLCIKHFDKYILLVLSFGGLIIIGQLFGRLLVDELFPFAGSNSIYNKEWENARALTNRLEGYNFVFALVSGFSYLPLSWFVSFAILAHKNTSPSFSDIVSPTNINYGPLLGACLCMSAAFYVSKQLALYLFESEMSALIIFIAVAFMLLHGFVAITMYFIIAHNNTFEQSINNAGLFIQKNPSNVTGFHVLLILIGVSGLLLLGFGVLVTIPIVFVAWALALSSCDNISTLVEEVAPVASDADKIISKHSDEILDNSTQRFIGVSDDNKNNEQPCDATTAIKYSMSPDYWPAYCSFIQKTSAKQIKWGNVLLVTVNVLILLFGYLYLVEFKPWGSFWGVWIAATIVLLTVSSSFTYSPAPSDYFLSDK